MNRDILNLAIMFCMMGTSITAYFFGIATKQAKYQALINEWLSNPESYKIARQNHKEVH